MNDTGGAAGRRAWSDYTERGAALFGALQDRFSFDDLLQEADRLGISSQEAVEHLRIMLREEMVLFDQERFEKTGGVP